MPKQKTYFILGVLGVLLMLTGRSRAFVKADNTKVNLRDKSSIERTAEDQSFEAHDVELTRQIRRQIVRDKSMSMYAHNIKIITNNGLVTLKGPLKSDIELGKILASAHRIAGTANVIDEMEVVKGAENDSLK